jgi:hypothetical protein
MWNDHANGVITPDSDPGSSLSRASRDRLRGNDGETPITVRLWDSLYFTAEGTLFLANAIKSNSLKEHDMGDSCHGEDVRPEAIFHHRDCFVVSLLAKTAQIKHVTKIMANWFQRRDPTRCRRILKRRRREY